MGCCSSAQVAPQPDSPPKHKAWIVEGLMAVSQKNIPRITRMGFTNTYFDGRRLTPEPYRQISRPKVESGHLWVDGNFSRIVPAKNEDERDVDIVWKRPEVCMHMVSVVHSLTAFYIFDAQFDIVLRFVLLYTNKVRIEYATEAFYIPITKI